MKTSFNRMPDWQPRLQAYLAKATPAAFGYGTLDCALFVAGAVRAMTGEDPAAGFRGTYTSFEGGIERLHDAGLKSHVDLVNKCFARIHPAFAQVGDIVAFKTPEGTALGVLLGEMIGCMGEKGLVLLPRHVAGKAWRVG